MRARWLLLIVLLIPGLAVGQSEVPRNIILMIGDGMGVSQVTAGRTYKGTLELEAFKDLGLILTHAHGKDYVTDSAAGATAMSTGVKSYNGAIAVGPDTSRLETVLERARKKGKKTGLVSSCSITHATPAAFVAHVPSRGMQLEIASQIAEAENDLYLGSGWGWFLPKEQGGRRTDGRNLLEAMKKRGFSYADTDSAFKLMKPGSTPLVLGLFAENHIGPAQTRKPSLPEMVRFALEHLSDSPNGFFLMVEGSQIDWAGHENNSEQIMVEMADFDDAVGDVVRFAHRHEGTLVIVTSDHETGGYALAGGSREKRTVEGKFVSDYHTAAMVPLFAMGPGSQRFTGIHENTIIGLALLDLLGR